MTTTGSRQEGIDGHTARIQHLQEGLSAAERQVAGLRTALDSNRRIGMAIGILMWSQKITEDEAFRQLRQASNDRNTKLHELAEQVIRTGTLG